MSAKLEESSEERTEFKEAYKQLAHSARGVFVESAVKVVPLNQNSSTSDLTPVQMREVQGNLSFVETAHCS